ncbi:MULTISPECIES: PTS sugar transporter subunit IIA [unclassified Lactobacillus]|uniref:PTS sugar transporter subunit IIA n=1 Tax=unclassified Lactobacillus TaxID=2620435 RepID=UPI000EFD0BAB|nr:MULTISPECIES: PTS sugar transporter subunit IIA [unclassified Lactobacillus]RMC25747.1 PTS sugar transporter subunit IIA [Lactobacillus sp. ESL0247]RMC29559.1 PTS sugar transporter subunit IIA [Lactobacillus sp. ESL0246]RMC33548.1 PTS sugar transporter subunit IIA [Lactobacillus sp. ESL0245]
MLRYFFENHLINISQKHPKDWQEAIRISGEVMKENNLVTDKYIDQVIEDIKQYGPYIVIVPGVAMPHSQADSSGVLGTGIGLTIFPEKVSFDHNDSDKDAQLFFMLAAKDNKTHMKNIANLSNLLMEDGMIEDLCHVKSLDDYCKVIQKHDMIVEKSK